MSKRIRLLPGMKYMSGGVLYRSGDTLPDTEETRLLQRLCQDRRKAVDMRTKCSNSLRSKLKEYYPQALQLVGESLETEMCCAFLGKWPRFQDVAAARPESLRKFYYKFNSRSETTINLKRAVEPSRMKL